MILGSSKFWVGMIVGTVAGAMVYHCATSKRAKKLCAAIRANMQAEHECMLDDVREKAAETAVRVADTIADKAMEAKEKVHAYTGK